MTPKEKAEELVNKYLPIVNGGEVYSWVIEKTKQCALIAVDEILKSNPYDVSKTDMDSTIDFWQEVKQEIEKI